jgi:hypothetical protein
MSLQQEESNKRPLESVQAEPLAVPQQPVDLASVTNAALERNVASVYEHFSNAGEEGKKVASQQEELIRKMLAAARANPVAGGERSLRDYLGAAQLAAIFEEFLGKLAQEILAVAPGGVRKAKKAKKKNTRLYCVCNQMYDEDGEGMIGCDSCSDWFHFSCIGIAEEEAEDDDFNYTCDLCKEREKKDRRRFKDEEQQEESEEEEFSEGEDEPIEESDEGDEPDDEEDFEY